jgi:diguanylate cyclase (GGDEF)-like protein
MQGRNRESLDLLLPLLSDGMNALTQDERGMLLNAIAGSYSMLGESAQAFAYMFEALRESRPARNLGLDVVLYCNLSHELLLLGDVEEGLRYAHEGVERCATLNNPRLMGVLLLNRMTCLTDLQRADEALPDLHRLLAMPADVDGRGATNPSFEQMAMTALRAADPVLGAALIDRARASLSGDELPDELLELAIAQAELLRMCGDVAGAVQTLAKAQPMPTAGLRLRCMYYQSLADAYEQGGENANALQSLRSWQALQLERSHLASQARHQAASLKTELLRLQRQRDEMDARQRSTEKARSELEAINLKLAQKILQVQALQASLKEQAVRDGLTGLFNRRYLVDVLPGMLALARRNSWALCIAIIDLDRFKSVNDEHGHPVGDAVLKSFASLLLERLRKSDVVCRHGGEEFCVLMPRTSALQGQRKLEAILKHWRAMRLEADGHSIGQQTFSAGLADSVLAAAPDESAEALLKRADDCALQAKRSGRNRVLAHHV